MSIMGAYMSILDIGILVVSVFFLWSGYRSGLLKTIFSLVSLFGGLAAAYYLYPFFIQLLEAFSLSNQINAYLLANAFSGNSIFDVTLTDLNFLTSVEEGLNALSIPSILIDPLLNFLTEFDQPLGLALAEALTTLAMVLLSFVSVYIISRLVISFLLSKIRKLVKSNKVVSSIDRFLGLLFGAVKAVVLIGIVMLGLIGLSLINVEVNTWLGSQLQLGEETFSIASVVYQQLINILNLSL
jgi:uncharacterized membrane protein required for colicin V production